MGAVMNNVKIENGLYNKKDINGVFPLVKGITKSKDGSYFVKVNVNGSKEKVFQGRSDVRIKIYTQDQVTEVEGSGLLNKKVVETENQAIERIAERFKILEEMTNATLDGIVRGMVVTGPPGVGKTYGVEQVLEKDSLFDVMASRPVRHTFIKGAMSALGLYSKLYEYKDSKNILVLDDCDSILFNEDALNILKAALDSCKKRRISWNTDSNLLRREGVPSTFEFNGSVIFITNLKFDNMRHTKIKDHLDAIMSRCHYLDLTLDTTRDKIMRIKQIARDGGLFDTKGLTKEQEVEIIDFMVEKQDRLREVSLRMAQKIADLRNMDKNRWKMLTESTCMKRAV
jgi:predicted AAA+ superfamily ATPase